MHVEEGWRERAFASRSYSDNASRKSRVYFRSCLLLFLMLQPVAPVLFAIYISCYAPMTNASVVPSESLQSRSCLLSAKKKKKSELHLHCLLSNVELFRVGKRRSGYMRFYRFYRKVLCLNTLNYGAIFRSSITFLPFDILYPDISEERKSIFESFFKYFFQSIFI